MPVNRCQNLNPVLNICDDLGDICQYMKDPTQCPEYSAGVISRKKADIFSIPNNPEEPYKPPPERKTESLMEYIGRLNDEMELRGIKPENLGSRPFVEIAREEAAKLGIRLEIIDPNAPNKPRPTTPCFACQSTDWWWNGYNWICNRCHPNSEQDALNEMPEDW